MKKIGTALAAMLAALLLFSPLVLAGAQGGALTNSPSGSIIGYDTGGTQAVKAGLTYSVNLNASSNTNFWAGVIGNLTGRIQLRNSGNKSFFDWSVTAVRNQSAKDIYTVVLATNKTSAPVFETLGTQTGAQSDTDLGLNSALSDNAANTFSSTGVTTIVGNVSLVGVASSEAQTNFHYNSTGYTAGTGKFLFGSSKTNAAWFGATMDLDDTSTNMIWGTRALATHEAVGAYDNATQANYQMLLFSNNSGTVTATTYAFYVELR